MKMTTMWRKWYYSGMLPENLNLEHQPRFLIETIHGPEGSAASFSPARGGIITSLVLGGKELLYLDQETFDDPEKNVRGGIPILFPNAGPLENSPLKQHGFARELPFAQEDAGIDSAFSEALVADAQTREVFPYNFSLVVRGELSGDRSFTLSQEVTNHEMARPMPLAMGLHPYFRVASGDKAKIQFDFPCGEIVREKIADWANGKAVSIENPGVPLVVTIPNLGRLTLEVSPEYQRVWVWSQPDKDFICIEPVMRDFGGFTKNPALVKPSTTLTGTFAIRLE